MNKDVECPYCKEWNEVCHDDGHGCEEDMLHSQECGYCDKIFTFWTTISFYYSAQKADCLNDAEHNYVLTNTYPPEFAKLRCTVCLEYK